MKGSQKLMNWNIQEREELLKSVFGHMIGIDPIKDLINAGFLTAPASTHYHGAYEGGLFEHSRNVADELIRFTQENHLQWGRPESPMIIGWLHDLCKVDQNRQKEHSETVSYEKNPDIFPYGGHGTLSVLRAQQLISLTTEEVLCIRFHMGAYETADWTDFGRAIELYPNVLWTHMADMSASKIIGV